MYKFGDKNNRAIRNEFEIWRIISSLFVHRSYDDLTALTTVALPYMLICEWMLGSLKFSGMYLMAGVFGNIFGSTFVTATTQGSEPAVYGLYGIITAYITINATGIKKEMIWAMIFAMIVLHIRNII